jgi:hypothetical protein
MKRAETTTSGIIPEYLKAELEEALENIARGVRDPRKMKAACEEMDRIREENRRLFGETDIAVELIRQTREQA